MKWLAHMAVLGAVGVALAGCAAGVPTTLEPTGTAVIAQAPTEPPATEPPTVPPTTIPLTAATPTATAIAPAVVMEMASANTAASAVTDAMQTSAVLATASAPTVVAPTAPADESGELAYRAQTARPAPPPPPADGSLLTVWRGPTERLEVALTFDAGADVGYAAEILDLLRDHGVKATFGMTGVWAEQYPDLVRRMVNEGHQVMNHTYDHQSFTGASTGAEPQTFESMLDQLNTTEQIVRDIAGYEMKPYARPPYGDFGPLTSGYLVDAGYYINVMWTCDSLGWKGLDAAQIVSRCTTDIGPGEIILLHVGAEAPGDFESLHGLITSFSNAGYSFVTVEEMLQP